MLTPFFFHVTFDVRQPIAEHEKVTFSPSEAVIDDAFKVTEAEIKNGLYSETAFFLKKYKVDSKILHLLGR